MRRIQYPLSLAPAVVVFGLFCATATAQLALTPPQTEGPYYPTAKPRDIDNDLTRLGTAAPAQGDVLVLNGKVLDPSGTPIENAKIEIWQTDARGIYLHPGDSRTAARDRAFQFYGEARADAVGAFSFRTIFPGPYTGRPRHIHAKITPPNGRTLTTQFYFVGDRDVDRDPIVRRTGAASATLMLKPQKQSNGESIAEVTVVLRR